LKKTRNFNGKQYRLHGTTKYKSDAQAWAKLKREVGIKVRIVPCGKGSAIYVRGKRKKRKK